MEPSHRIGAPLAQASQKSRSVQDGEVAPVLLLGDGSSAFWSSSAAEHLDRALRKLGARLLSGEGELASTDVKRVVLIRADAVMDPPLLEALLKSEQSYLLKALDEQGGDVLAASVTPAEVPLAKAALESPGSVSPQDLKVMGPDDPKAAYWHALRKREVPLAARLTKERRDALEWRLFLGTYKGVTDLVTKYLWPRPAFYATKVCIRLGASPNMVTLVSFLLTLAACWHFYQGQWAIGLVEAWLMTFLDTVDGKLARVTYQYSPFGNVFDHGIDLVHPPFWYLAWAFGLAQVGMGLGDLDFQLCMAVIIGGYILQRLIEGFFICAFKIEIHVWRSFDSFFRLITARRNPNLLLLTGFTLIGRPDWGLWSVAIWTALSLLVHLLQVFQAWGATRGGKSIHSWLTQG